MSEQPSELEGEVHPRRMLDRYEVIAEIARGGMGTVLLARLEGAGGFERLMAIKLMHEHLAQDPQFVTMLLDEARTAANIHHPNAVGIVDVAESAVGYYLVMSYVEGFTLAELVSHRSLDAKQRIRLGLRVLIDACHGLHAAHTAKDAKGTPLSIVHRDVSPQNVLVGLDGVGRIVDFGIALAASRIASSRPGVLKGKPSYMAPEQVQSEACDARADVFALGIVLWEILTGERLFQAEMELATLLQVVEAKVAPPSTREASVTPELDAVVLAALQRLPADRTADARALALGIEQAAEAAGLLAPTHEVADAIERLFADAVARRQAAIRHHLSTSRGEPKPLAPGQLGLIPRLYDSAPAPRSAELTHRSGVRERNSRSSIDPAGRTESVHTPLRTLALETPVITTPAEVEPPKVASTRRWWIAGALGAVGLVGVLVAVLLSSGPKVESPPVEASSEAPAEQPVAEAADEATEVPAAPDVVEPESPPIEAVAPVAAPTEPTPEPIDPATDAPAANRTPRPARRDTKAVAPPPADEPAPNHEAPRTPALESNPYLVH